MRRTVPPAPLAVLLAAALGLGAAPAAQAGPSGRPPERGRLDVLFVGAHPDDEASTLSTLGQLRERGARVGVLTVTRGEGGGNAVGTEEGPPLGLLREGEERRAVGGAGITDVHYLDEVDFYYTVSAPLTARAWNHRAALERVVRLVRETRPRVVVTMDPAPLPGQHGHHQEAARLAAEAYFAAADRTAFPGQLRGEGLRTWAPRRLFMGGGATGPTGPSCETTFTPADPRAVVYGVWAGRRSTAHGGRTWAQIERDAQRQYVSQGWAGFPDVPADPNRIGCDYFTQLHSRSTGPGGSRDAAGMLAGTGAAAPGAPAGPAVTGEQEPLPRVADYDAWAVRAGLPALAGRVKRVLTLGSGRSRPVRIDLTNTTGRAQSGTVTLALPRGFAADAASRPYTLAANARGSVTFTVRNTDPSLPTSNQGGVNGDHDYTITTTSASGPADVRKAALELVPVATLAKAPAAPVLDGRESPGEYPGPELDLSRVWEGTACASPADCSATGRVAWTADALHVLVTVRDDTRGAVLGADDCKRHWRTDSVEITVDPRGDSENTSTTFKTGIFPAMADGRPCFQRDADNHQGLGPRTAPGMRVAASVTAPYTGYTVEARIPFTALPGTVDPARMGLNLFVYDSDTQDRTGQTRIGWSTWGGVQGDPYRWGLAALPGLTPPRVAAKAPVLPSEAARSVASPQSIIQAAATGVPLAGGPAARARLVGRPSVSGGSTTFRIRTAGPGRIHAHVWDGRVLGSVRVSTTGAGVRTVTVPGARGTLAVAFESRAGGTASLTAPLR
ncbi:sugar-binding protein [Actinomadura kijaniata]|uniref:sugar-binding protein n=1 Tax=Actinomadura kijaniata TaxID=46161 RepID=UPI0008318F3E|nr:sugar-binding protein [Actinomadura kijaniata]